MPAGKIGAKSRPHRRNARKPGQATRPVRPTPIRVAAAAFAQPVSNQVTLSFDQPVLLRGVPRFRLTAAGGAGAGTMPTAARLASPSSVVLTFPTPVAASATVTVPFDAAGVSNASGGSVNAGVYGSATGEPAVENETYLPEDEPTMRQAA